jgi:ankyrin repeat protein
MPVLSFSPHSPYPLLRSYGHASKGLPWTLQLLNAKGVDLNQVDSLGATPLHVCAEKNLARPVRMLVDAGANVNVKHQKTGLTPLQMACCHDFPDVETIRSFLDKGAYPNWRDFQGRSAFEMVMSLHNRRAGRAEQNGAGGNLTPGGARPTGDGTHSLFCLLSRNC